MKKIMLIITALSFLCSSYAQETAEKVSKNEFGFHAGATTGLGLSYRRWFKNVGVQITALPIKTDNLTFISASITGLYSLKETKYVRAFLYLGNHYYYSENRNGNVFVSDQVTKITRRYNIGFGPGFSFGSIVGFNLMFGYGFYDVLNKFEMYPTGEIGLYYKF